MIERELRFRRGGRLMTKRTSDARVAPLARMLVFYLKRAQRFSRMAFQAIGARHRHGMIGIRRHRLNFGFRREVIKQADDGDDEQGEEKVAFGFHKLRAGNSFCLCVDERVGNVTKPLRECLAVPHAFSGRKYFQSAWREFLVVNATHG